MKEVQLMSSTLKRLEKLAERVVAQAVGTTEAAAMKVAKVMSNKE